MGFTITMADRCALYRLNDNGEYLRNLKKAKFYIDSAIEYEEKEANEDDTDTRTSPASMGNFKAIN